MAKERTYKGKQGSWGQLCTAILANRGELGHLEVLRSRLAALLSEAQEVTREQAALLARRQEVTREIQAAMSDGERLATVLRLSVKAHYGIRSEKLTEFGLQPFRSRKSKEEPLPQEDSANQT
ncbi:MAG TPA: hypothetical protein VMW27_17685 [Thermoanaerobaculia bacterium]|nr:hypothetical protein [Thermoanaerobaculia bacterium]